MSFPTLAVLNAMLFPAARPGREGGCHRFSKRPSSARLQPRAKSTLSEKSRVGNFFSEPVTRTHRVEREIACVNAAI